MLIVLTERASGYMKTASSGSLSKKLCTLAKKYRPNGYISMSPLTDIDLGYQLIIGVESTGEVSAQINCSRAMSSYGFPNTAAFLFLS